MSAYAAAIRLIFYCLFLLDSYRIQIYFVYIYIYKVGTNNVRATYEQIKKQPFDPKETGQGGEPKKKPKFNFKQLTLWQQ